MEISRQLEPTVLWGTEHCYLPPALELTLDGVPIFQTFGHLAFQRMDNTRRSFQIHANDYAVENPASLENRAKIAFTQYFFKQVSEDLKSKNAKDPRVLRILHQIASNEDFNEYLKISSPSVKLLLKKSSLEEIFSFDGYLSSMRIRILAVRIIELNKTIRPT